MSSCGPAVATVKIKSRTYAFKGGTCQKDSGANMVLSLNLGTLVAGAASNDGKPYMSLSFVTDGSLKIDTVTVYHGGKKLLSVDTVAVKDTDPSKGTFMSTKSVLSSSTHFTRDVELQRSGHGDSVIVAGQARRERTVVSAC